MDSPRSRACSPRAIRAVGMTYRTCVNDHRFDSGVIQVASRFSMLVSFDLAWTPAYETRPTPAPAVPSGPRSGRSALPNWSASTARAAYRPAIPCTPGPGVVAEEQR